jgi:hypothetical protein
MGKSIPAPAILLLSLFWLTPLSAADPFAGSFTGSFEGEEYRLTLDTAGGTRYEGLISIGGEDMPLVASRHGDRLLGRAGIGGDSFEFSAELRGNALLLRVDSGAVIRFGRDP